MVALGSRHMELATSSVSSRVKFVASPSMNPDEHWTTQYGCVFVEQFQATSGT